MNDAPKKYEIKLDVDTLKILIKVEAQFGIDANAVTEALEKIAVAHKFEFASVGVGVVGKADKK